MLFLITGNDIQKRRLYTDKLLSTLVQKRPSALVIEKTGEEVSLSLIEESLQSTGLFDQKNIYIFRGSLEEEVVWKYVLENIDRLQKSEHAFVFVGTTISKKLLDVAEKVGVSVHSFVKDVDSSSFDVFSITNELVSKNIPHAWLLIKKSEQVGTPLEETVGVIIWQLKSIYIARTHTESSSGLKPFVYKKSKSSRLTDQEVKSLYKTLVVSLHEYKRGGNPLIITLEKALLSL